MPNGRPVKVATVPAATHPSKASSTNSKRCTNSPWQTDRRALACYACHGFDAS
jgi:hypothetical protein